MPNVSRYIALVRRPHGVPAAADFALREEPLAPLQAGEALVRNLYISVDPYMRGRMRDVPSHMGPFPLDAPITGSTVGRVVSSRTESLPAGVVVTSFSGWRDTFVTDGSDVDALEADGVPLSAHLGVLGMPGFTGWYGLTAAGAVGSVVVQLARRRHCRVVGVAGSDEKCRYVTEELGAHAAVNYRSEADMAGAVRRACPDGVDVYFDNTGGPILQAALANANLAARMPICGMISTYNAEGGSPGPSNLTQIIGGRITVRGFLIRDHGDRRPEFLAEVAPLVRDGSLRRRETIVEGLERAPEAFIGLFSGQNIGKMVVSLSQDDA